LGDIGECHAEVTFRHHRLSKPILLAQQLGIELALDDFAFRAQSSKRLFVRVESRADGSPTSNALRGYCHGTLTGGLSTHHRANRPDLFVRQRRGVPHVRCHGLSHDAPSRELEHSRRGVQMPQRLRWNAERQLVVRG